MICDVIKQYSNNETTIELLCETLKEYVPEDEYCNLAKKIHEANVGPHFNEEFSRKQISKMYYTENGIKYYAPYFGEGLYNQYKRQLKYNYNKWDFDVTLNMIKSDNYLMLKQWFPDENLENKIIEMTINWLNDEDNTDGKIWKYFKH